jgi:hypothetical protein
MAYALIGLLLAIIVFLELVSWRLLNQRITLWQELRVQRKANEEFQRQYAGIIDVGRAITEWENKLQGMREVQKKLDLEYADALAKQEKLTKELALLEENLDDVSFGLYNPHFTFQSSEAYKTKLYEVRNHERDMIRARTATVCPQGYTVNGDRREGARMIKQYEKLMIRAFNGECDAAVAEVAWNNVTKMEERVGKAYKDINELGGVMHVSLATGFLELKLAQLRITQDAEEKRYAEREQQRRIREQIRDEERAKQDFERVREKAAREEADYAKALSRARQEALETTGIQLEALTKQIKSLEVKVEEARLVKQRAMARAELTRSGFVYVISNIGSFGERVFKIGMTRRLDPMDRIYELSDASVPFPFDLHVMLYSDNAPKLEADLHELVSGRAVNLVNPRKEFYRDVELDEIETFVRKRGLSAQFIKVAEAKEFRQSVTMRQQHAAGIPISA